MNLQAFGYYLATHPPRKGDWHVTPLSVQPLGQSMREAKAPNPEQVEIIGLANNISADITKLIALLTQVSQAG